jgi:ferredoxin
VGVTWVRQIDRTYDVAGMRDTLKEALTTDHEGPKVIVASSECMLNRQRREKPLMKQAIADGRRVEKPKFGVDEDVCTGDHACMRLSGCPSLTLKIPDDPLRDDPVAYIDQTCVGCGNCGEVADAAVLCPSFYRADLVHNPSRLERWWAGVNARVIGWLQARRATPGASNGSTFRRRRNERAASRVPSARRAARPDRQARGAGRGRAGRRGADQLDRRSGPAQRIRRAGDIGGGGGAAHRRHDLLCRDAARRTVSSRSLRWRRPKAMSTS